MRNTYKAVVGENISRDVCRLIRAGYDALSPYCRGGVIVFRRQKCGKKMLNRPILGQSQAYAQALQYAYAPNMLTAQQLTAAGLSNVVSF